MTLSMIAAIAYGTLALVGGIIAYTKVQSKMSLISGSVSGILLIASGLLQRQSPSAGLILATVLTAALILVFVIRLAKTRKFMPAGLMMLLGVPALAVMVQQWLAIA
jgi:uncharacterized membrane protein (UPF0136 family)